MAGVTVIGCVQADVLMSPVTELPPAGGTLLTEQMSIRVGAPERTRRSRSRRRACEFC